MARPARVCNETTEKNWCPQEGYFYGCWFWPMVGSGVFINTGSNPLRHETKYNAATMFLAMLNASRHDDTMANSTRALGHSSLQIKKGNYRWFTPHGWPPATTSQTHEMVLAADTCIDGPAPLDGPCVPVPLRTGTDASQPCTCSDLAGPLLNCRGVDLAARSPAGRARRAHGNRTRAAAGK